LVKVAFSKLLTLLGILRWHVGPSPHVMTKLEKGEDLASLIQASKIFYVRGLKNAWDSWNWMGSSSKKEHKKEITLLVNYHESEMING